MDNHARKRQHLLRAVTSTFLVGAVLAPAPAAEALENVRSSLNAGCTLWEEQFYESSDEAAGVAVDGTRLAASAVPATHTVAARSSSRYPGGVSATGEDCGSGASYSDVLTVAAGSSGLAPGDTVTAMARISLASTVAEHLDADSDYITQADVDGQVALTSNDDCVDMGEGWLCAEPIGFEFDHRHEYYGWRGEVFRAGERFHEVRVDGEAVQEERVDEYQEYCTTWPCGHAPDPEPYTFVVEQPITLVVGDTYDLESRAGSFTQAYTSTDVWAEGSVDELTFSLTPPAGSGVELLWASQGEVPDTTAPTVTAEVSPAANAQGWHTTAPTVTVTATDDDSGVAEIVYEVTGSTGQTTVPESTATIQIAGEGRSTVTYWAVDQAGNASAPQTVTVDVDTLAPSLVVPETVEATSPDGAPVAVGFAAFATDPLAAVSCAPVPGSLFPVGTTQVSCTATDQAGNETTDSFDVVVSEAGSAFDDLRELVASVAHAGVGQALAVKLDRAEAAFAAGNTGEGCDALATLRHQVEGQRGKKISAQAADRMLALLDALAAEYDC